MADVENKRVDFTSLLVYDVMRLLTGRDHETPVFVGPGRIELKSTTAAFHMFASHKTMQAGFSKFI